MWFLSGYPLCQQILLPMVPAGLMLDIVGFYLVVKYGHSLFMRTVVRVPKADEWNDGDFAFTVDGPAKEVESRGRSRRRKAHLGVGLILTGFVLQIAGWGGAYV